MLTRCLLFWFLTTAFCSAAAPTHPAAVTSAAIHTFLAQQPYSPAVIAHIEQQFTAGDPQAALLALTTDPTNETRVLAAQLLGEFGADAAAQPLWRLLRDESEAVRMMAAAALPRLHARGPVPLDTTSLTDNRPNVRRLAAETLSKIGNTTVEPALLGVLTDPDEIVRWQAAKALVRCGTAQAQPGLLARLKDDSLRVRTTAAAGLGRLGNQAAVAPLAALLADDDWHVRVAAATALNGLADRLGAEASLSVEAVLAKLRTCDYAMVWAARAFGITDNGRVLHALSCSVVSDDRDVAYHATEAVIRLKITPILPLLKQHRNDPRPAVRERIVRICGEIGGANEAGTVLVAALSDAAPPVVVQAVTALCRLHRHVPADVLVEKLAAPDPHLRAAAARFYGELGQREFIPLISPLLFDAERFVRCAAFAALGKLGDRRVIPQLLQVLAAQPPGGEPAGSGDAAGRGLVIGTKRELDSSSSATEFLEQKLTAIRVLGDLRAQEAVPLIISNGWQSPDAGLRAVAAYALGQIGDRQAMEPLVAGLRRFYDVAPGELALDGVIAVRTNPRLLAVRMDFDREVNTRSTAVWALGQLGDPAATGILNRALKDTSSTVREAAAEALKRITERPHQMVAVTH